jgi:hypothetical protein
LLVGRPLFGDNGRFGTAARDGVSPHIFGSTRGFEPAATRGFSGTTISPCKMSSKADGCSSTGGGAGIGGSAGMLGGAGVAIARNARSNAVSRALSSSSNASSNIGGSLTAVLSVSSVIGLTGRSPPRHSGRAGR